MTDYNDGNWHGWNGGECPVHPESVVVVKFNDGEECTGYHAEYWDWHSNEAKIIDFAKIIAFRVTKPYVEQPKPREFWINEYDWGVSCLYDSKAKADEGSGGNRISCIHVREVIEE